MATDEIIVAAATGRAVAGYFRSGALARLEFAAGASDRRSGEIVLGRARQVSRGVDAAFIDIGDGASGFLNRADAGRGGVDRDLPADGEAILVQISREAEAEKAAKLTAAVVLPGRILICCPGRPGVRVSRRIRDEDERQRLAVLAGGLPQAAGGWFVRRAALAAATATIEAEAAELLATWRRILEVAATAAAPARLWRPPDPVLAAIADEAGPELRRVVADDPGILAAIHAYLPDLAAERRLVVGAEAAAAVATLEAAIEAMLVPTVALAGGGLLRIAETPALTAIDVDAGTHGLAGEGAALAVNLAAAEAIAGEVRRRELGGHIVIDFVAMRSRRRRDRVVEALRAAFAGDRLETHVAGYTRLGKVELSRRRVRPSVPARLGVPCPACAGSGSVLRPEVAARRALRTALRELPGRPGGPARLVAAPGVTAALRGQAAAELATVEARLGRTLVLGEDPAFAMDAVRFDIDTSGSPR